MRSKAEQSKFMSSINVKKTSRVRKLHGEKIGRPRCRPMKEMCRTARPHAPIFQFCGHKHTLETCAKPELPAFLYIALSILFFLL